MRTILAVATGLALLCGGGLAASQRFQSDSEKSRMTTFPASSAKLFGAPFQPWMKVNSGSLSPFLI